MRVLIIGGGFAGLNAAKTLGNKQKVEVTLIDRSNYHLFQPLFYQVAMAGLSPAEIAVPIRNLLAGYNNIQVLQRNAIGFDLKNKTVHTDQGDLGFDYLIIACGVHTPILAMKNGRSMRPVSKQSNRQQRFDGEFSWLMKGQK